MMGLPELKSKLLWMLVGMPALAIFFLKLLSHRRPVPRMPGIKPTPVPEDIAKVKKELKKRGLIE